MAHARYAHAVYAQEDNAYVRAFTLKKTNQMHQHAYAVVILQPGCDTTLVERCLVQGQYLEDAVQFSSAAHRHIALSQQQ